MITRDEARQIVEGHVSRLFPDLDRERQMVVNDDSTLEREYGWLFSYVTVEFLRTGNPDANPIGPGPILVLRESGDAIGFPSAYWGEYALGAHERTPDKFPRLPRF